MAKREAGILKGSYCPRPGVSMSPIDFIRSHVLEHYEDEKVLNVVHRDKWMPIEMSRPSI